VSQLFRSFATSKQAAENKQKRAAKKSGDYLLNVAIELSMEIYFDRDCALQFSRVRRFAIGILHREICELRGLQSGTSILTFEGERRTP